MANTFKFGNGNWAVKDGFALAYNDENNNFKPLPFDFTRASSATRVNKQGLVEVVPSGKPRIDFLDNTNGHLLLEPSRTNMITYSEDFTQSVWTKNNATIDANSTSSPFGTSTASTLENGTGNKRLQFTLSTSTSSTYNVSIFFKAKDTSAEGSIIAYNSSFTPLSYAEYNVQNGTIGTSSGTSSMENYGNGWYRCRLEFTATTTTSYIRYRVGNYLTGDDNKDIFIFGSQVELGSYATSYIPTEGSSVTRVVDTCFQDDLRTDIINANYPFIIYAEAKAVFDSTQHFLTFGDRTASNKYFTLVLSDSGAVSLDARANATSENLVSSVTVSSGDFFKVAVQMESATTGKLSVNGTINSKTNFSSQGANASIKDLLVGMLRTVTDTGRRIPIKDVKLYNTALTDTELQNLTS
jgi:hypothetical protein